MKSSVPERPWKYKQDINEQLISFLEHKELDGVQMMEFKRKDFGKELVAFCDGNKKMNGPAMKIWAALTAIDEPQMALFKEIVVLYLHVLSTVHFVVA